MNRKKLIGRRADIHCLMCGKNFYAGESASCGGIGNGRPLCSTKDIQRHLDKKAKKTEAKP